MAVIFVNGLGFWVNLSLGPMWYYFLLPHGDGCSGERRVPKPGHRVVVCAAFVFAGHGFPALFRLEAAGVYLAAIFLVKKRTTDFRPAIEQRKKPEHVKLRGIRTLVSYGGGR